MKKLAQKHMALRIPTVSGNGAILSYFALLLDITN
jgi:hypothetical protein